jgi:hypothetical protein
VTTEVQWDGTSLSEPVHLSPEGGRLLPIVPGPGPEHPPTDDELAAARVRLTAAGMFATGAPDWDAYRRKTL